MIKKVGILFVSFFVFSSVASAMPPHPKLLEKWTKQGVLERKMSEFNARQSSGIDIPAKKSFPATGSRKVLVILMNYSDKPMDGGSTPTFYSNLFNGADSSALSWKKYYQDMSNGQLNLEFTVVGPYAALHGYEYYGADAGGEEGNDSNPQELVAEAVEKADANGVDFSLYDNDSDGVVDGLIVIHQGSGQEFSSNANDIWSHMWTISATADGVRIKTYSLQPEYLEEVGDSTIGVFVHEFGHLLGLPDLYDTAYATDGVGKWSLMAGGSWNGPKDGDVPAPLLAWERSFLGWADAKNISSFAKTPPSNHSVYPGAVVCILCLTIFIIHISFRRRRFSLLVFGAIPFVFMLGLSCGFESDSGGSSTASVSIEDIDISNQAVKIPLGDSKNEQYLLAETIVQKDGTWSEYLPGEGLLVTQIDETVIDMTLGSTINIVNTGLTRPHGVVVKEADGSRDLWEFKYQNNNAGDSRDTYYKGNSTKLTPFTETNTNYTKYDGSIAYPYSAYSGVSILNVSEKSSTMTFDCIY